MTYLKSFEFPDSAGFHVVAGRSDGLQRLMVVSGRLPAGNGGGPVHAHLGGEVLRIISGEIIVRVGDERRLCAAGDVAVVPPNVLHGFRWCRTRLWRSWPTTTSASVPRPSTRREPAAGGGVPSRPSLVCSATAPGSVHHR
jgi:Cupin domain